MRHWARRHWIGAGSYFAAIGLAAALSFAARSPRPPPRSPIEAAPSAPRTGVSRSDIDATAPSTLTLSRDGYRFEVHLDPSSRQVSIFTLSAPRELPRRLSFSLLHDDLTGHTVELKALEPQNPGDLPKYAGKIDWFSGPYVAAELQFPLSGTSNEWKRIKEENRPTS